MEVNIYIGFWTLKVKWTQYRISSQANLKNARAMFFSKLGGAGNNFQSGSKISWEGSAQYPDLPLISNYVISHDVLPWNLAGPYKMKLFRPPSPYVDWRLRCRNWDLTARNASWHFTHNIAFEWRHCVHRAHPWALALGVGPYSSNAPTLGRYLLPHW
jgi:hypothetical protein